MQDCILILPLCFVVFLLDICSISTFPLLIKHALVSVLVHTMFTDWMTTAFKVLETPQDYFRVSVRAVFIRVLKSDVPFLLCFHSHQCCKSNGESFCCLSIIRAVTTNLEVRPHRKKKKQHSSLFRKILDEAVKLLILLNLDPEVHFKKMILFGAPG